MFRRWEKMRTREKVSKTGKGLRKCGVISARRITFLIWHCLPSSLPFFKVMINAVFSQ